MPMVSLKTDDSMGMAETYKPNPYGCGTSIHLNDDQCEALGFKAPLPAGTVVMISAQAVVVRSEETLEMDGDDTGPDVCMTLQLTDAEIKPKGGRNMTELTGVLYPES